MRLTETLAADESVPEDVLFAIFFLICTGEQFSQDLVDKTFAENVFVVNNQTFEALCLFIFSLYARKIRQGICQSQREIFIEILYFKIDKKAVDSTTGSV